MISEGMSVARLNLSHGTISQHKMYVENAKQAAQELDAPLGILIDIPGPKYRVGKIIGDYIDIKKGQKLIFGNETILDGKIVNLKVWPEGISKEVGNSKQILLDDGLIKLSIDSNNKYLLNYPWPGNVRELRNLIERIAILQPETKEKMVSETTVQIE